MSRYIDAEKFKRMYREQLNCVFLALQKSLGEAIDDVPSVDVREVVHGKWVYGEDGIYCSECKALVAETNLEYFCKHNFCPNCGAIMDRR